MLIGSRNINSKSAEKKEKIFFKKELSNDFEKLCGAAKYEENKIYKKITASRKSLQIELLPTQAFDYRRCRLMYHRVLRYGLSRIIGGLKSFQFNPTKTRARNNEIENVFNAAIKPLKKEKVMSKFPFKFIYYIKLLKENPEFLNSQSSLRETVKSSERENLKGTFENFRF